MRIPMQGLRVSRLMITQSSLLLASEVGRTIQGEYLYKTDSLGIPLLDENGHMIVAHDLEDIADAFRSFAKKQKLSFGE